MILLKNKRIRMGCWLILIAGILVFYPSALFSQAEPDFLSISSIVSGRDAPQWSPDGTTILFMSGLKGGLNLWSISWESRELRLITEDLSLSGVGSVASQKPSWSPTGEWVSYVSSKSGAPELWLWSAATGHDIQLTELGARINAFKWSPDGKWIVFAGDRYGDFDIWKVSVPDGEAFRLTADNNYEVFPSWTPDGKKIIYSRLDERWVDHEIRALDPNGEGNELLFVEKDFFDYRGGTAFGYAEVSPDGEKILFRSPRSGWLNYWTVSIDGKNPEPVAPEKAEQSEAHWSPDGKYIAYISNHNGTQDLRVVPAAGGEPNVVAAPQGMGVISKIAWSPDGTKISCMLGTPTQAADLYVVWVETGETRKLTSSQPEGDIEKQLVTPEKITYPSEDGFIISAYLYKPKDMQPGQKYPGLMYIHGGPTSQFKDTYQAKVQFFTHHGYVVLLPNIRGSSGYGKEFRDANNRCWGHCDLKDVVAGVEYLKTKDYVNPDKMGITGTSYGGIMTMAAVTFAPEVFQAAVSCSGYGDMNSFFTTVPELQHMKLLEYELGPWPENKEVYDKCSPIFFVENVSTPIFIIHGTGKTVAWRPGQAPPEEGLEFARALDQYYKIYRYKAYPGETYYVYSRENTEQMLEDMKSFFNQFLKDKVTDLTR
jgi:dipeptidyl aminopeptidase/acylaminoacyl peptidase